MARGGTVRTRAQRRCARQTWSVRDSPEDSEEPGYVYPSTGPKGQHVDDLAEHARIRPDPGEVPGRPLGDLVGQTPRRLDAEPLDVAVAVEEVVDDLEEKADVLAEGDPRSALVLRNARDVETDAHARHEQPARLEAMELLELGRIARDVAELSADHPERRVDEIARDLEPFVAEREPERL